MKSAEILSKTDRTSWSRIMMVAGYFWPRLRLLFWLLPVVSAVVTLAVTYIPGPAKMLCMSLLGLLIVLAPVRLTKRPDGEFTFTLPALGMEKCIVLFLVFFIAVPLLIIVPAQIVCMIVSGGDGVVARYLLGVPSSMSPATVVISWLGIAASVGACLWAVMKARRNRTLLGVVAGLSVNLGTNIFCGFFIGLYIGLSGMAYSTAEVMDIYNQISVYVYSIIWGLAFIIFTVLAVRAVSRRQF